MYTLKIYFLPRFHSLQYRKRRLYHSHLNQLGRQIVYQFWHQSRQIPSLSVQKDHDVAIPCTESTIWKKQFKKNYSDAYKILIEKSVDFTKY